MPQRGGDFVGVDLARHGLGGGALVDLQRLRKIRIGADDGDAVEASGAVNLAVGGGFGFGPDDGRHVERDRLIQDAAQFSADLGLGEDARKQTQVHWLRRLEENAPVVGGNDGGLAGLEPSQVEFLPWQDGEIAIGRDQHH